MENNTITLTKQELIDLLDAKATLQAVERIINNAPTYSWDSLLKAFFPTPAPKVEG